MTYTPKYQGFIDDQGLGGSVVGVNKLARRQAKEAAKRRALMPRPIIKPSLMSRVLSPAALDLINTIAYWGLPTASLTLILAAFLRKSKRLAVGAAFPISLWFLLTNVIPILRKPATLSVRAVRVR